MQASTKSVRVTLRELHARYKKSLTTVKQLSALDLLNSPGVNRKSNACTADKILYNHAIELCQVGVKVSIFDVSFVVVAAAAAAAAAAAVPGVTITLRFPQTAALDEIFGNPDGSFAKYQSAQIIFHSLSQSVVDDRFGDDKNRIQKLQEAVEQRLVHLNSIGYGYMYDTIIATC